ncbi:hypothetical protein ASB7_05820 [Helicobacter ailurogastricus]|nr:hypothetical protein ASB7_05820 [Helicobacter ailurogastricus]
MRLGLNIDHIATLREARKIHEPDPLEAIFIAKNAGVDLITLHLREDRRHIHEDDVKSILKHAPCPSTPSVPLTLKSPKFYAICAPLKQL